MPNYEDCVIYTIRTCDGLYVGSTCNFTHRKHCHKYSLNNENDKAYNYKLYKIIRENDNEWDMQPYKLFPCKNKMEMEIEEERCRVELNADLNSMFCYGHNTKQRKEYHKQRRLNNIVCREYIKQYRIDNKERLKEKKTCECGCEVANGGLTRHQKSKKHLKLLEEKQENIKEVYEIF